MSTRDIEEVLRDAEVKPLVGKDAVNELTEELWAEYERFCARDLSGFDVVYLFVDAAYESLRRQAGLKEAMLCAWGNRSGPHRSASSSVTCKVEDCACRCW